MSDKIITGTGGVGAERLSWHQIWLRAVTQPSLATYQQLISLPDAASNRAYKWMAILGLLNYGVFLLAPDAHPYAGMLNLGAPFDSSSNLKLLLCAPVFAFIPVLGLALSAVINHILAIILGGEGEYEKLVFALGAFSAPLSLTNTVLAPVPCLNLLSLPLALFNIVLGVIAVNAVYDIGWLKAVIVAAVPLAFILLLFALGIGLLLFA